MSKLKVTTTKTTASATQANPTALANFSAVASLLATFDYSKLASFTVLPAVAPTEITHPLIAAQLAASLHLFPAAWVMMQRSPAQSPREVDYLGLIVPSAEGLSLPALGLQNLRHVVFATLLAGGPVKLQHTHGVITWQNGQMLEVPSEKMCPGFMWKESNAPALISVPYPGRRSDRPIGPKVNARSCPPPTTPGGFREEA